MKHTCELDGIAIDLEADEASGTPEGILLGGRAVALDLPFEPVRFYRHGWQSWSLTTWQPAGERIPRPKPDLLAPMQVDPRHARDRLPGGSWFGAVELADGRVLLLGSPDLETRVDLEGRRLRGWSRSGPARWLAAAGSEEDVFSRYAAMLRSSLGRGRVVPPPRVWSSWYSLYTAVSEGILRRVLDQVAGMPFDVFEVDDGWQAGIGDWEPNGKFPSGIEAMASRIREAGFVPGLWLAPLLAVPSSRLYRDHPDWLLRDGKGKLVSAGFNWAEPLAALDCSRDDVQEWLAGLMRTVRAWVFGYVKLDFLYAGALAGESAYREVLRIMREALGDAYLLACGAPILPSLGLCDGLRVGPDVAAAWEAARDSRLLANPAIPGSRNAVRTTVHRLWLADLVHVDPDVVYFRSHRCGMHPAQKWILHDLASICGCRATSDPPAWLTPGERDELLAFLTSSPRIVRTGRYAFAIDGRPVDFSQAVPLPRPMRLAGAVAGWLAGRRSVLRLFGRSERSAAERAAREEFTGA